MRIGIDLDNTLICYDQAFARVAREEGLLPPRFEGDKRAVRRALLAERADGHLWEKLQGMVYGRRIDAARPADGVAEFLGLCWRHGASVAIVSHKTRLAHHDPLLTDLRAAALHWLEDRGLLDAPGCGVARADVWFEATRDDKVRRIGALGCEVFVDDLAEVLAHAGMPAGCRKILLGRDPQGGFEQYASWREIGDALFAS